MKFVKILIVLSLVIVVTACGGKRTRQEKLSAIISKIDSPFLVASLSPENIINKAGINDGVLPYTQETLVNFFTSEEETGVDTKEKIQIVASKGNGMFPNMYAFFKVANSEKFKNVITKELNGTITQKDGFNTVTKAKDGYVIVWNDEFAVVANVSFNLSAIFGGGDGGSKTINRCITYLNYANEGEIDKTYTDFLNKDADISSLFNSDYLVKFLGSMRMIDKNAVKKLKAQINLNTIESYLNFEKGSIKFESNLDLSDQLLEKLSFIGKDGVSDELFAYGKTAKPMLKYSFKISPKPFVAFIDEQAKQNGTDFFTKELAKLGFTKNDLVQTFTGEVLVMIDDVKTKTKLIDYGFGSEFESKQNEPIIGAVIGIADKNTFNKIISKTTTKTENGIINLDEGFFGYLTNDVFFVSNDSLWMQMVINNKTITLQDENGTLKQHPYGFYAGFENLKNTNFYKNDFAVSETLENISGFANLSEVEIDVILKDKSQNSLKVLVKFISDQMEKQKQKVNSAMTDMFDEEVLESMQESFGQLEGVIDGVEEGVEVLEEELKKVDVDKVVNSILDEIKNN